MENYTFLALQGPDGTADDLAPVAEKAMAMVGRLNVLHLGPVPLLPYTMTLHPYGIPSLPDSWIEKHNAVTRNLEAHQEDTRAYLLKQGLTGEVGVFCAEPAAFHDLVGLRAVFSDVSIVLDSLRNDTATFDDVVYGLLFHAPGPVILNVQAKPKALSPDNIFIAWDNSLHAARAVRAALPLLKDAKEVTIACFDANPSRHADGQSPGSDLATWLSHHGVTVTVQEYATGHDTVGGALQMRAKEMTADLVVMGAYGRARWNERFFGGTTEAMIKQRELPVLLAH